MNHMQHDALYHCPFHARYPLPSVPPPFTYLKRDSADDWHKQGLEGVDTGGM